MYKRIASFLTVLIIMITMMPYAAVPGSIAADEYKIRDKWGYCNTANYAESQNFVIFYGDDDQSGTVDETFLKTTLEKFEDLWKFSSKYLGMENISVDIYGKSPQKYKTNIYLLDTGLDRFPRGHSSVSFEDGYGAEILYPNEIYSDELSIAHDFGYILMMHQRAWVDQDITEAWRESIANWFKEMYRVSGYYLGSKKTDGFESYLCNMSLSFPHGRNYRDVWPFLVYLSYNPDDIPGLGMDAVKRIISEAKPDEYPFDTITRIFGTDAQTIFGHYSKRMAAFDFNSRVIYKESLDEFVDEDPLNWNMFYTVLQDNGSGWLQVPQEEAPMQAGINIIPLIINGDAISAELRGISDDSNAGWKACIVTVDPSGKASYSELFGSGQSMSMPAKDAVSAYITVTAMPKTLVRSDAFHKENVSTYKDGAERRRYPYELRLGGADVQQTGNYHVNYTHGHPHSNGGGWVSGGADVDDSVYIGPHAVILGDDVELTGNVRVEDYAIIGNNVTARDNAVIGDHAVVSGDPFRFAGENKVNISGNAVIGGRAVLYGVCSVSDNAKVLQKAFITDKVSLTDNAVAKGTAYLYGNAVYSGNTVLDGDYCNEKSVSDGVNFGWLDDYGHYFLPDDYIASYEFSNASDHWASDEYTATAARQIGAKWSEERTSAKGVMNFDGGDSRLLLDCPMFRTDDIQISIGALWKGGNADQELFHIGDSASYASFTPCNEDGVAEFRLVKDRWRIEKLTAAAPLGKGEWSRITIRIIDGKGSLLINGQTVDSRELSMDMRYILRDDDNRYPIEGDGEVRFAVIGRGFKGAVDYIKISSGEAEEPTVSYSGKEGPDDPTLRGDVNSDNTFNVADLVTLQNWLLAGSNAELADWQAGDLCEDGIIDVFDAIMMRKLLLS